MEEFPDIRRVAITRSQHEKYSFSLCFEPDTIGGGGNSGFQALNLAASPHFFGARRIALVGFDMSDAGGKHWYGRNTWPNSGNPDRSAFARWIEAFDNAATELARRGVSVVNLNKESALRCFPFASSLV